MSDSFVKGQRLVNEAEPNLGLGVVADIPDHRTVQVVFPACNQVRCYRIGNAPLRHLVLHAGQIATNRSGERMRVEQVTLKNGLLNYTGGNGKKVWSELELDDRLSLEGPIRCLTSGRTGMPDDIRLRVAGLKVRSQLLHSSITGLGGARVDLLPHQLYIASRVSQMEAPRVLLADQVGLGKTIEAGLIFSSLRQLGRADRVLLVVPDSLVHQWLAEMVRRFNELFTVIGIDAMRDFREFCQDLVEQQGYEALEDRMFSAGRATGKAQSAAPFENAQRAILPQRGLRANDSYAYCGRGTANLEGNSYTLVDEACRYNWDLLIVDEAHHMEPGSEAYRSLSRLAAKARSVLLLTGTPGGGTLREFALLHLLDPVRYRDYESYKADRDQGKTISDWARELKEARLTEERRQTLVASLREHFAEDKAFLRLLDNYAQTGASAVDPVIEALVDRYGPGRVLFRNRRERLSYLFPGRNLHPVPLRKDEATAILGHKVDRRAEWVVQFLREHPDEKVVLIAKQPSVVLFVQERLKSIWGVDSAVFHEELSLVERDKQAAWFASKEGAQILLCSEIGSEGRNFQFAHHLIMWDIPLSPALVEQRIGRLDRIGQKNPVQIHILYMEGLDSPEAASQMIPMEVLKDELAVKQYLQDLPEDGLDALAQGERLFVWHMAMGSFCAPLDGSEEILAALDIANRMSDPGFKALLQSSLELRDKYREMARQSVDYLSDINSFDEAKGQALKDSIMKQEESSRLAEVVSLVLERFHVSQEELTLPGLYFIKPGDLTQAGSIPGLRQDGLLGTFKRELALLREDVEFLSLDHKLVDGVLSQLLDNAEWSACATIWRGAPRNGLLIQCLFVLEALGDTALELPRYLAPVPFLLTLDVNGRPFTEPLPASQDLGTMKHNMLSALWGKAGSRIEKIVERAEQLVQKQSLKLRDQALEEARQHLQAEQERLVELQRINPSVTEDEVKLQSQRMDEVLRCLNLAAPRLDSIRLILMEPES